MLIPTFLGLMRFYLGTSVLTLLVEDCLVSLCCFSDAALDF